ncbi:hypothetical protein QBC47DRAFT_383810 [Echria macrotheca]|uniref:Uncharacterized protein n=1 Tax=Echria macrotheca TaxID=438768 RepID=A0AAJ0FAQ2_9PEZI|nr:hypothetical protein QBC47DRAFT_383810 [Echria macrotheca]
MDTTMKRIGAKLTRRPVQDDNRPYKSDSRMSTRPRYSPEELAGMSEYDLENLPREVLERFPPEKLRRLPIGALYKLSSENLGRMDDEDLARKAKGDCKLLLKLEPGRFFDVLMTDPSLLNLYRINELCKVFGSETVAMSYLIRLPPEVLKRQDRALLDRLIAQNGEEYRRLRDYLYRTGAESPLGTYKSLQQSSSLSGEPGSNFLSSYSHPISPSEGIASLTARLENGGPRAATTSPSRPPLAWDNRGPIIPRKSSKRDESGSSGQYGSSLNRSNSLTGPWSDRHRDLNNRSYLYDAEPDRSPTKGYRSSTNLNSSSEERREMARLKETVDQMEKTIAELRSSNNDGKRQRESEFRSMTQEIASLKSELEHQAEYTEKRITNFLRKKGVNTTIKPGDDAIDMVLSCTEEFYAQADHNYKLAVANMDQATGLAAEVQELKQRLARAEVELHALREQSGHLQEQAGRAAFLAEKNKLLERKMNDVLAKYKGDVEQETAELRSKNVKLEQEIAGFGRKFDENRRWYDQEARKAQEKVDEVEAQWRAKLQDKDEELAGLLAAEKANYEKRLHERDESHSQSVAELKNAVKSLRGSLVDNYDDFRPATDDALKDKYSALKLAIQTVTFNSASHDVKRSGSGFSGRSGDSPRGGRWRFELQSAVWAKVLEGFFSEPFGFGALGPLEGRQKLFGLYQAWRDIFDEESSTADAMYYPQDEFEIFRTNLDANKWRSATFQSIFTVVFPKGLKKGQQPSGLMVRLFSSNMDRVRRDIEALLEENSDGGVLGELESDIVRIVQLAGELALEFGCQRALLGVESPMTGETVKIGQGFVDCQDGDANRGHIKEVDLVVAPKLFRVGDGRNDLKTVKVICSGDIYPRG